MHLRFKHLILRLNFFDDCQNLTGLLVDWLIVAASDLTQDLACVLYLP